MYQNNRKPPTRRKKCDEPNSEKACEMTWGILWIDYFRKDERNLRVKTLNKITISSTCIVSRDSERNQFDCFLTDRKILNKNIKPTWHETFSLRSGCKKCKFLKHLKRIDHFFKVTSRKIVAVSRRPSHSWTLNLMCLPLYVEWENLYDNLCLAALCKFNFISHLMLVKHYHSIIVNLETMKALA